MIPELLRKWRAALRLVTLLALVFASGIAGQGLWSSPAEARPPAGAAFCAAYPSAPACVSGTAACATCHTVAPARNLFGAQVGENIPARLTRPMTNDSFVGALPEALRAIEALDADNDGYNNLAELLAGSKADDASSVPLVAGCSPAERRTAAGSRWNVCGFDAAYAFRKVHLDFCGRSPTRAETTAFNAVRSSDQQARQALAGALNECLASRYWLGKDGVLWNLANPKIGPVDSIKAGEGAGAIPLADYEFDYNLFTYANTGDRDVRDLLVGQYFVRRTSDDPVTFELADETSLLRAFTAGQTVARDRRAGMITTRWFTTVNTMFTAVPRTTAAQAYRAYLGLDISRMEGLHPVVQEPYDFDAKGVDAPECAVCHSTLDPLSYPFTRYNGIATNNYSPTRLNGFVRTDGPEITNAPEAGMIFGQPVANLLEWSQVAANSDAFAQKVVWDYWKLLIGREPGAADQREFTQIWRGLKDPQGSNYRVERMLHALILTDAYGTP